MFGIDWNDPQTLWLNLTNLGLGIVMVIALAAVGYAVLADLVGHRNRRIVTDVDAAVKKMLAGMEPHAFHSPEIGLTMADGGEPEKPAKPARRGRKNS